MWKDEGRQSVVEVGVRFIGDAKRAVHQDVRAIGQVEASSIEGSETGSKSLVGFSEGVAWAHQTKAGEENVIRRLQSGGCDGEDVLW